MEKRNSNIILIALDAIIFLVSYLLCQPTTNEVVTALFNVIGITIFFSFFVMMAKIFVSLEILPLQNPLISKIPFIICIPYIFASILCVIPLILLKEFTLISIVISGPIAFLLSKKASKILFNKEK